MNIYHYFNYMLQQLVVIVDIITFNLRIATLPRCVKFIIPLYTYYLHDADLRNRNYSTERKNGQLF